MKFKADAGTRTKNQTFEIVRVVKDSSSTIKIYAQHISHKLEYMSVRHGIKVSGTADLALKTWAKNLIGDYHFDTWSDIDTVLPITFLVDKMENARLALGGVEGSILDIWGGEYEFDNQTVRLHKRLGRRAPTVLEYGRNILSAESDESIESAYTSVVPFATYTPESQEGDSRQQEPVLVTIPEGYVDSKYVSMYANRRIKVVDFSSEFKDESTRESKKKDIPTPEKLKALAIKYMENNRIGAPKINTKIEYVDLAQTLDYAERGWIEELELCDIVPVYYPQIGITEDDAKVTKVVYDFLNERNESVEFGMVGESIRSAMTGGLAGRLDDLEKNQQSLENRQSEMAFELPKYLLDAKGNRVWNETPDENIEHKVGDIWFEKNGLYQRLYIWNGEMWEKRIDTEDVSKVGEKFDAEVKKINQSMATQTQQTAQALRTAGANASAIEAAKGAITKLNQDLAGAKQTNQAAIDRLKSDFANAQKTANDQTAFLRSDLANIRTTQTRTESEIAKQVQALNAAKTELAGVKSAQATFEQTTTRRLAELSNVSDGKADKSQLVQTAEELSSRIASVHLGRRNLLKGTKELVRYKPASEYNGFKVIRTVAGTTGYRDSYVERTVVPTAGTEYIAIFYARASENDYPMRCHFYNPNTVTSSESSSGYTSKSSDGLSIIRLSTDWQLCWVKWTQTAIDQAKTVIIGRHGPQVGGKEGVWVEICAPALFEGNLVGDWTPAYEDQEERVSAVESSFKQKADSLEAGVSSLREGLKTKADSSALTVLSDSIKQSVKSLETNTQTKLDQKLSTAEFDVRASGIRQEILNATKDKADKALVTAEAGRLREEFSKILLGNENLFVLKKASPGYLSGGKSLGPAGIPNEKTSDFIAVTPDEKVTFQIWVTVPKGGQAWRAWQFYTKEKELLSTRQVSGYEVVEGKQYARHLITVPANASFIRVSARMYADGLIKVERSDAFSDWTPSIEDADGLITEAKATFERTAQGLRTDLTAVQAYVNADGTRAEVLLTQSREETARQITAERKLIEAGYVGIAQHTEDVKGISRRFEELKTSSETKLAEYRQMVDGQFTTISQQIAGKASQTDFQRVQETSKLYERLIGSTEKEIIDKVSRMTLSNELFQVEVSKNLGLRTVQYQMANAWAVQNLNSNGDIVSQINMTGPNVRIQGESIHLDGKTLIDNGIIKNAMIESMLADKITAGTLNAANVNIVNLNANKIVGLDANFIKSKIELAFIEWMKGKVISAQNDAMQIDLNNGQYNVMTDQAAIRRVLNGYPNQFLKFTSETEGGAPASVTVLGANRDGTENSKNDSFAGIRLFSGNKVERTEIISDVVRFATGAVNYRGWEMRTLYGSDNRQVILQPFGNVTRSNIVANYFNGIDLVNVLETLNQMMANLGNHTGRHDIFGPIRGLGARKYAR
nr:MAG TPA: tail protein [Caudoviricetes sp.]